MQVEGQSMLRVEDKHLKFLHAGRRTCGRVLRVGRENDLECECWTPAAKNLYWTPAAKNL